MARAWIRVQSTPKFDANQNLNKHRGDECPCVRTQLLQEETVLLRRGALHEDVVLVHRWQPHEKPKHETEGVQDVAWGHPECIFEKKCGDVEA